MRLPVPAGELLADAVKRVALSAAAVIAATAFTSPAEELKQKWMKAAYHLISLTAPELALTHHSRFAAPDPEALVKTAALQLQTIGGKNGAGTTSAALFLEDWQQFLLSRGDKSGALFPIDRCDLEAMAQQFTAAGGATKSIRIAPALALLRKLGCLHVPLPDGFVIPGAPPTKKAVPPPGARNPPTPLMVLDMERGARDVVDILPSGFSEWPYGDYVRHECVRMRLMARGEGYASSRFLSVAEKTPASASVINQGSLDGVSVIVCAEDKGRRKDALYFLPEMSLVFPGQCPWQSAFAEAYAGRGYMYQDWAKAGPDAATVLGGGGLFGLASRTESRRSLRRAPKPSRRLLRWLSTSRVNRRRSCRPLA